MRTARQKGEAPCQMQQGAAGTSVREHHVPLFDFGRGACPGPPLMRLVLRCGGDSHRRLRGGTRSIHFIGDRVCPSVSFISSQMRNDMSKLQDQETLNLGQVHLVVRGVCRESNLPAQIRERRLLGLIYAGRPHVNDPALQVRVRVGRPARPLAGLPAAAQHCRKAEPHSADHGTANTAPRASRKASGSTEVLTSPPPPGLDGVIGHPDGGLRQGPPWCSRYQAP